MVYAGDYEVLVHENHSNLMRVRGTFSTRLRAIREARLRFRSENKITFMQVLHVPSGRIIWEKRR